MAKFDMREWATKGAEQRLLEIAEEAQAIFAAFPELRARGRGFAGPGRMTSAAAETAGARAGGRRRKRSAAARKRMSDAQKARWAKFRTKSGAENAPAARSDAGRAAKKK